MAKNASTDNENRVVVPWGRPAKREIARPGPTVFMGSDIQASNAQGSFCTRKLPQDYCFESEFV